MPKPRFLLLPPLFLIVSLTCLAISPHAMAADAGTTAKAAAKAAATANSAPAAPGVLASPASPSQPATTAPNEPKDASEVVTAVKDAIAAGKSGSWWYMSSVICLVIMFLLKAFKVLEKIGRAKYIILPILSLAAALLAAFQGGVSIEGAVGVFTSSWAMGMLEELFNHGILGKPHATRAT